MSIFSPIKRVFIENMETGGGKDHFHFLILLKPPFPHNSFLSRGQKWGNRKSIGGEKTKTTYFSL